MGPRREVEADQSRKNDQENRAYVHSSKFTKDSMRTVWDMSRTLPKVTDNTI